MDPKLADADAEILQLQLATSSGTVQRAELEHEHHFHSPDAARGCRRGARHGGGAPYNVSIGCSICTTNLS